jgi:hypothetical protein
MATMAGWYPDEEQFRTADTPGGEGRGPGNPRDLYRIRPLPNEVVCFYVKNIDNSRVVRPSDPRAPMMHMRSLTLALLFAVAILGVVAPNVYSMIASYEIHQLDQEYKKLLSVGQTLEYQEAQLLSPRRMRELASQQGFIDPPAQQVYHLSPMRDESYALNVQQ